MQSTHMAMSPLPQLPLAARKAHVFPELQSKSLLSLGQLCNSKFTAVSHKDHVKLNRREITITGQRHPSTGLYYIDLPQPPPVAPQALHPFACSEYAMKTKAELVQYLHRCAFSLVVNTWTKSINSRYFAKWPGLTSELVHKHLPKLIATAKGHLKNDRKNIRPTKPSITPYPIVLPSQHDPPGRSHQVLLRQLNQLVKFPQTKLAASPSPPFAAASTSWYSKTMIATQSSLRR